MTAAPPSRDQPRDPALDKPGPFSLQTWRNPGWGDTPHQPLLGAAEALVAGREHARAAQADVRIVDAAGQVAARWHPDGLRTIA